MLTSTAELPPSHLLRDVPLPTLTGQMRNALGRRRGNRAALFCRRIANRSAESRRRLVIDKITLGGNSFDGVLNIEGIPQGSLLTAFRPTFG
jgi:hypothetical protein